MGKVIEFKTLFLEDFKNKALELGLVEEDLINFPESFIYYLEDDKFITILGDKLFDGEDALNKCFAEIFKITGLKEEDKKYLLGTAINEIWSEDLLK